MSDVTDVIVAGFFDDPVEALARVNAGEWAGGRAGLRRVPKGAKGLSEHIRCDVFDGAFSHLNLDALKAHLGTCAFTASEKVELLYRGARPYFQIAWRSQPEETE